MHDTRRRPATHDCLISWECATAPPDVPYDDLTALTPLATKKAAQDAMRRTQRDALDLCYAGFESRSRLDADDDDAGGPLDLAGDAP
jgi:hypothetical protein